MSVNRRDQLLNAVDHLVRVHDEWENDPQAPVYPTARFEAAVNQLREDLERDDVPRNCLELANAINHFLNEWDQYATGYSKAGGVPHASFWKAYRFLIAEREGIRIAAPKRPLPVKMLLSQGVSHNQIALHIYGHNGEGPFIQDGQIESALILKEAEDPGSVIPADWIHPSERERLRIERESLDTRLGYIDEQIADAPEEPLQTTDNVIPNHSDEGDPPESDSGTGEVQDPKSGDEDADPPKSEDDSELLNLALIEVESRNPGKSASELLKILKREHPELAKGLTVLSLAEMIKALKETTPQS